MSIPTAEEMAKSVSSVFSILHDQNLIESYDPISTLVGSLQRYRGKTKFPIKVSTGTPIVFRSIVNKRSEVFIPQIYADLEVDLTKEDFPYSAWKIALEVNRKDENKTPVARWHFDLANSGQEGPKLHLQCGGHISGNTDREAEFRLDVPRWPHPAVDLLLLTEIAVANFFPEEWKTFRDHQNWCSSIHSSQCLCYEPYFRKVKPYLDKSSQTILNNLWNDIWI